MVRKIVVALLCLPLSGFAQTIAHQPIASQFNNWRACGSVNLIAGANLNVTVSPCTVAAGGVQSFSTLAASTPIKINDPGNTAIDEILTPTAVSGCTATFTTTNAHPTPWYITSGTGGLQDAINATAQTGVMNTVILDSTWFAAGWNASTIYAAAGSPYLAIQATNVMPNPTYRWNGSHYIPTYALLGIANPTLAASAAAGTSPTTSNNAGSSGNIWTANVTTGTATTTGTLFTQTVGTPPASGNMDCTVQSVGANVPPAFTVAISGGVATIAVTVAPPTATAYIFAGACN